MTEEFSRILIIKPSSLGDVVHALPVLRALRGRFPKAHIAWFVQERWSDILRGRPELDEVLTWSFRWSALPELFRIFSGKKFDLAVDLQGLLRSGVISYLSGAPVRVGFKSAREGSTFFYTHRVGVPKTPLHAVDRYLLMAESLGAAALSPSPDITVTLEDERRVEVLLRHAGIPEERSFVVLNPMSRWRTKRWPLARFALLADRIQDAGITAVLIGERGEAAEVERMKPTMRTSPVFLAGKTDLKLLAALLKKAKLLVTNDSGPMHLAAAVGTPVVALFGPTDPVRTGPYFPVEQSDRTHVVIRHPVECSPCLSRWCRMGDHRCMNGIEVEEVFEQVMVAVSQNGVFQ